MWGLFFQCGCNCNYVVDHALNELDPLAIKGYYTAREVRAKCISVYDGDTCTVLHFIDRVPVKATVRLYGIDAPELRQPKDLDELQRKKNKDLALEAKVKLQDLILNKSVTLVTKGIDKYGRILCNIEIEKGVLCFAHITNVTEVMLKDGHGYEYHGGKKEVSSEFYSNSIPQAMI